MNIFGSFSDFGGNNGGGGGGGGRRRCTERDTEYFGTNLSIRNNGPRNKVVLSDWYFGTNVDTLPTLSFTLFMSQSQEKSISILKNVFLKRLLLLLRAAGA